MAPLNPNRTARLWVKYTSVNIEHELLFRFDQGVSGDQAVTYVSPFLLALTNMMRADDAFLSARYAQINEDFSFPVQFVSLPGDASNTGSPADPEALFISFTGRDPVTARRTRYDFFSGSSAVPHPSNNRINRGDNELTDAALDALIGIASNIENVENIVTIGLASPIINDYVNVAFNSYFQRKQRRG